MNKLIAFIIIIIFYIRFSYCYTNSTLLRLKREIPNRCKSDSAKYQCETIPDCIETDLLCDGNKDCSDGSDERKSICEDIPCPSFLFRCKYGACINSDSKCNGIKECVDNSDEADCPSILPKINTNCRSNQFECKNGQCIDEDSRCNGTMECEDKTDETEELCLNSDCPRYAYKCKYGACVDGDAGCNGIKNCADNSDEIGCGIINVPSTAAPPITGGSKKQCRTPKQPENGKWFHFQNEFESAISNIVVAEKTQIIFKCNNGYKLSSTDRDEEIVYCRSDGLWTFTKFPTCELLCPAQYNRDRAVIKCLLNGSIIPCDKATAGTQMTYKCENFFEPEYVKHNDMSPVNYCLNGKWHFSGPKCEPICGEKQVSAEPLIVGSKSAKRGSYPWVTALYSNRDKSTVYQNICAGSLISISLVLTAAHCVTYERDSAIYPVHQKYFQIAAGKYYRNYNDDRDEGVAQYSAVEKVVVHEEYQGSFQNYRFDIALLKLKKEFAYSKVVQPVCLNTNSIISTSSNATVTGWGYTTPKGNPSDELKEIDLPYTNNEQCRSELEKEFALKYLIGDKLCAGYVNQNMSVCKGDSGGGLVVKGTNSRYFIEGIVSLGHGLTDANQRSCNVQRRALFTKIHTYSNWIQINRINLNG